jgi:LacI family transcriptional regulator
MASKKVTAKEVAKKAGISQTAVSMILNQYPDIHFSEETKKRVLDICNELGYKLPEKKQTTPLRNRVLLTVYPSGENYHYSRMISEIQQFARRQDYQVLSFTTLRDSRIEETVVELCTSLSIAGAIFLYNPVNSEVIEQLAETLPVVMIYDKGVGQEKNVVELDNYRVGELMTSHLLELGHRRIAAIFPSLGPSHLGRRRRIEGIRHAYEAKGIESENLLSIFAADEKAGALVEPGDNSYHSGYRIAGQILDEEIPVTAFIANNDMEAYGIMDAIYEHGKRIPQDYSVIGCDNLSISKFHQINLTTVEPYSAQRAKEAVNIIIRKIEHRQEDLKVDEIPEGIIRVAYAPKLIRRGSTGKVLVKNE